MEIRKGTLEDLPAILQIYEEARAFMKEQGNGDQWGDRWPPEELIRNDIGTGLSHVCVDGGEVVACFVYFVGEEPDYRVMVEGAWPDERPYSVVHRIATKRGTRGVAKFCLGWAYEQHAPLRMDTHKNNIPMQNLLRKCGFQPCGVIRIHEDGSLRDAFIRL